MPYKKSSEYLARMFPTSPATEEQYKWVGTAAILHTLIDGCIWGVGVCMCARAEPRCFSFALMQLPGARVPHLSITEEECE